MIEPTFFIQNIREPRIVAPVRYPHIWEGFDDLEALAAAVTAFFSDALMTP
jgi:hypothetical protein